MSEKEYLKYLNPSALAKITNIELKAKMVVEGFMTGLHKSPYHGFSVEFAQHRQYMPGDDFKYLDWRVHARTDKYFIKQYEEETNVKSYILLDISKSMDFSGDKLGKNFSMKNFFGKSGKKGKKSLTKLEYASYIAASLSYLMMIQRDAVSLTTYDTAIRKYIPPSAANANLKSILKELANIKAENQTGTANCLNIIAERIKRRGLIILLSDLFDNQDEVLKALKHFRYNKNEVIVFQIIDPLELSFIEGNPVRLIDLETKEEIYSRPGEIKNEYMKKMESFIKKYKDECLLNNIEYTLLTTESQFDISLLKYLNRRSKSY